MHDNHHEEKRNKFESLKNDKITKKGLTLREFKFQYYEKSIVITHQTMIPY